MTNKEALTATLSRFGLTEADIDLILFNQGLSPDAEADSKAVKVALYNEFVTILPLANVSEGGYSISWNAELLKLWFSALSKELGKPDPFLPRIKNISNRA